MFIHGGGSGQHYFWLGDMVGDPICGLPPGDFPQKSDVNSIGYETKDMDGWEMVISPTGRCPSEGEASK